MSRHGTPSMPANSPLFAQPGLARADGPDTMKQAARDIGHVSGELRARALAHIEAAGGATCDEVEVGTGMSHQTASARIRELRQLGSVRDSGQRRPTRSGRKAIVWEAVA